MLVIGAFQALELTGMLALIGMTALLSRDAMRNLRGASPLGFQMAVALGLGISAALLVLALGTDVVPDSLEAGGRVVLGIALAVATILVVRQQLS